jgi:hypothetical protein
MPGTCARLLIAIPVLLLPAMAHASLGAPERSVDTDQARMNVRQRSLVQTGSGARHTLMLENGGEVRQYANAAGVIYAVRWAGPGKPDLESLLGVHFATFQADNAIATRHGLRRAPTVNRSNLRVVTGGRPGAFWGLAWLPQAAPAGFDPAAL